MGANSSHEPLKGGDVSSGRKFPNGTATGIRPYVRSSIRKSLRRRKGKHKAKNNQEGEIDAQTKSHSEPHSRTMEKLKRTLSMKKKKEPHIPESSKPHVWQTDEASVRQGTCSFSVKYLGCVEVFESRGMQVCEEALRVLRQNSRRRPVRGILYVSGDGLRVVDDDTKGLLVDQTIEKVSFCAPDRHHERGFSYICRDGTTRRWMCHGFIAAKESQGERLSHAVGCAFAVCLEKKQRRDQDSGVTMSFDQTTSTFTRMGSFRQMSMTEMLSDPQESKPSENPLPLKKVENPHAIARPHATPQLLQRQGSFRVFSHLNQSSPFKRQLSLRLCDLPSNLERTRSMTLDNSSSTENNANLLNNNTNNAIIEPFQNENVSQRIDYDRPSNVNSMPPIPETTTLVDANPQDAVSAMCQQVSAGLSLLSSFQETLASSNNDARREGKIINESVSPPTKELLEGGINWTASNQPANLDEYMDEENSSNLSKGEEWLAQLHSVPAIPEPRSSGIQPSQRRTPMMQFRSASLGGDPISNFAPSFHSHASTNGAGNAPKTSDPFDADWAALASKAANPNNPFIQPTTTKAFEIHM